MDILNNSDITFSTDALTQLSNLSPAPAFHKNEQLKRERLPGYECGLEYSLIKKIKLNKGDDSQNDSKITQIVEHIEADDDSNRLVTRKDSLKNTQRNRTLIRLEQSDPDTSNAMIRENNSKRSSFSSGEIADFNLRQYDLYADLQRSVADESYGLGDNSNLGHEYNVESEGLLINQPTDKNLIENLQMYSSGSMMSPANFMGQIDAAYQESLQFYLKQKQTKFDQFMKKMEDILSLCTDTSIEAPLNCLEEQDSKPKTLKYIPNKQISVNKKQKKNGKKRTY